MRNFVAPHLKGQSQKYIEREFPGAVIVKAYVADAENIRIFFRRTEASPLESKLFPYVKDDDVTNLALLATEKTTKLNEEKFEIIK